MAAISAYINAGGRGTRLNGVFTPDPKRGITKALLSVGKPPITLIEHHINNLLASGAQSVVAGVGDHPHVANHVRNNFAGAENVYAVESETQLGNGGDLVCAVRSFPNLFGDHVLITNVDTVVELEAQALMAHHLECGGDLTIALTRNAGVPNQDAFYIDAGHEVLFSAEATVNSMTASDAAELAAYRASSTGILVVRTSVLRDLLWTPSNGPLSLYRDIVALTLADGAAYGYDNGENFFLDVGTEATWHRVQESPSEIQPHLQYRTVITPEQPIVG